MTPAQQGAAATRTDPRGTSGDDTGATTATTGLGSVETALVTALADRLRDGRHGALPDDVDVDAMADRMVAALPTVKHEADALLGPFHDTASVAAWRGVTRQAIAKASTKGDLLGLKIGDGSRIFPSFQFGPSGAPLPHLREVLALLDPDRIDPWGSALWLNTASDVFGGTTAAEALRDGRSAAVLGAARRAEHAWLADA